MLEEDERDGLPSTVDSESVIREQIASIDELNDQLDR